jgi:hypothetical protein
MHPEGLRHLWKVEYGPQHPLDAISAGFMPKIYDRIGYHFKDWQAKAFDNMRKGDESMTCSSRRVLGRRRQYTAAIETEPISQGSAQPSVLAQPSVSAFKPHPKPIFSQGSRDETQMLNSLSEQSDAANCQPPDENNGGAIQTLQTPPAKKSAKGTHTDGAGITPLAPKFLSRQQVTKKPSKRPAPSGSDAEPQVSNVGKLFGRSPT